MSLEILGRQTIVYGLGHIVARIVAFLLLPIYTNVLSGSEFGTISLIYTFLGFMTVILHYGLDASLLKHYVPADDEERTVILSNAYTSFILTGFLFCMCFILLRNQASSFLFGETDPQIVCFVAAILFFDVLWSIHLLILRAEEKLAQFVTISFLNVCLTLGLNVYFVVYLNEGVMGVVKSNLITSCFLFTVTSPIIFSRISFKCLSKTKWKKMMHFGIPFLPAGFFSMILELSDRYFLKYFTDLETVGIYNAGYKVGMFMLVLVMAFNMGWQPYFLKKGKSETEYIAKTGTFFLWTMTFFWLALVFLSKELVQLKFGGYLFFGEEFWPSIQIVPYIAGAYVFQGLYLVQLPGVFLKEKTSYVAIIHGLGAICNIILNVFLIPIYGITGAAVATTISFFLMAFTLFFINKKIFPISYEKKNIFIILISALSIYFLFVNLNLSFVEKILMTLSFPALSLILGVIRIQDIKTLIKK